MSFVYKNEDYFKNLCKFPCEKVKCLLPFFLMRREAVDWLIGEFSRPKRELLPISLCFFAFFRESMIKYLFLDFKQTFRRISWSYETSGPNEGLRPSTSAGRPGFQAFVCSPEYLCRLKQYFLLECFVSTNLRKKAIALRTVFPHLYDPIW